MNVSALYFTESEAQFQASVIRYAELMGWKIYHVFDSRRSRAGFPDLVMVRRPRCLFVEIKAERGKLSHDQFEWLAALDGCGVETYVWRPSQWKVLEACLR